MTLAVISITNRCNLRCKMCDIGSREHDASGLSQNLLVEEELSVEEWASGLARLKVTNVDVVGVEPLLYPRLEHLLAAISPHRKVSVTTNGWLIDTWFEPLRAHCHQVTVSLDGLAETHDAIRGVEGSFARAFGGLRRLREAGQKVRVSFAINPDNVGDMEPLQARLAGEGIPIVFNHYNYIHPDSCRGYPCTPSNLAAYDPAAVDVNRLHRAVSRLKQAAFLPPLHTRQELETYYRRPPVRRVRTARGCAVLEQVHSGSRFVIAPNGDFIPGNRCWINKPLGNMLAGDLPQHAAWLAATVADIRDQGLYPPCQRLCCAGKVLDTKPHGQWGRRLVEGLRSLWHRPGSVK